MLDNDTVDSDTRLCQDRGQVADVGALDEHGLAFGVEEVLAVG